MWYGDVETDFHIERNGENSIYQQNESTRFASK